MSELHRWHPERDVCMYCGKTREEIEDERLRECEGSLFNQYEMNMDDKTTDLSLNYMDLCMLFVSYATQFGDYVKSNGGGQGMDMKIVDFFLQNIDKFGSATAKALRQTQQKPQIIMPNAPKAGNTNNPGRKLS